MSSKWARFPWANARLGATLLLAAMLPPPPAAPVASDRVTAQVRRLKELQWDVLTREARGRIEEIRRHRAEAESGRGAGPRRVPRGETYVPDGEPGRSRAWPPAPLATHRSLAATDVRVNDPAGDAFNSSQNEPSIAAWGDYVLVAWNDRPGDLFPGSLQGFGYSTDHGASFVDGGELPAPADAYWFSDPVVTVNEKTGEFYYCGALETLDFREGIGVVRGTFSGSSFGWDSAGIAAAVSDRFLDKPWITADSSSGNVYLTYTDFNPPATSIVFQRSLDQGKTWSAPMTLASVTGPTTVQGSRPAVGPDGEVYVVWMETGPPSSAIDYFRIRKSVDGGVSFGAATTAVSLYNNFGTGAPGFNRELGIALPSIAVDRSENPSRGRVYLAWNEAFDWYDDLLGPGRSVVEVENNDFYARATSFTPGDTLRGAFRDTSGGRDKDNDYYSFSAIQGVSYVFWCDSLSFFYYTMRVVCSDTLTYLSRSGDTNQDAARGLPGVGLWTAPATGTYHIRMHWDTELLGGYRILTGIAVPGPGDRGRDQRDVFVASSSDGVSWGAPVRANDDSPWFDNWLPEVAVSSEGDVYAIWYDWRDATAACGGSSNVYMARSGDGGGTWTSLGSLSSAQTAWTQVQLNTIPSQGDYLALFANDADVYAGWTDGRFGTPDIFAATVPILPDSLRAAASASAEPGRVSLSWRFRVARVVDATLYRFGGAGPVTVGGLRSDAGGYLAYSDTTVAPGVRYTYHLGVVSGGVEYSVGRISVRIPSAPRVAIRPARPNPLAASTRVTFEIPVPGGRVEVTVFDLAGRAVRSLVREFRPAGVHDAVWDRRDDDGRMMPPGVYVIRVSSRGQKASTRVSVIP